MLSSQSVTLTPGSGGRLSSCVRKGAGENFARIV